MKVASIQKVEEDFQIAQKMGAENYPGIKKIKILTFFAFSGLIYLQAPQISSRSIINNPICWMLFTHST
jgi:hypothetical protein